MAVELAEALREIGVGLKVAVPATLESAGKPGQFAYDSLFFYLYTGDGATEHRWGRIPFGGTSTPLPGDTTAPTINGPFSFSIAEGQPFSTQLAGSEAGIFSKAAGLDGAQFGLTTGGLLTLPAKDFEQPGDTATGSNNSYQVAVVLTDAAGNPSQQTTFTVNVTDVSEGGGTAPTYDATLVPLYIQLTGDRDTTPLKIRVFTDNSHAVGGSIRVLAYPTSALSNPVSFTYTPTAGQAASEIETEIAAGLAALTGTQRIEAYWVTADNRISRASNMLIWGPNDVAPVLSAGEAVHNVTATTAEFSILTNMSGGTLKGVAVRNGIAPDQGRIIAGQNSDGSAADWSLSQPVSAAGPQDVALFDLMPATDYDTWFVHVPAVGPATAPFRGPDITTIAASVFSVEFLGGFRMAGGFPTLIEDLAIGDPDANRQIIIQSFNYGDQPNFRIAGQLATLLPPGDRGNRAYALNVPLGTTADIALEAGFVSGNAAVAIWRVVGGAVQTPPATQGNFQVVADQRVSVSTPDGAATLVAAWAQNGTPTGFSGATLEQRIEWAAQDSVGALYVGQRVGPANADIALTGGTATGVDIVAYNITPAA